MKKQNTELISDIEEKEIISYSKGEETVNVISHLIGVVFGFTMLVLFLVKSVRTGETVNIVASLLYGLSIVVLYSASTIYHSTKNPKVRRITQKIDHASINLLIGGSNIMFFVAGLRSPFANRVVIFLSLLCFLSMVLNAINVRKYRAITMVIYIVTSGAMVIATKFFYVELGINGFMMLIAGLASYLVGLIFYAFKKRGTHASFHFFVLLGTVLHCICAYLYVLR